MDSYMNMRTDEGTFGSYHPNDLVEAIGRYFENGGGETNQQNHWGLQLYNPNNAMPQYMGQQQEPGNLAPSIPATEQTGKQKDGGHGYQVGFNPDALNNRLMASIKAPSYSSSKADVTDNTKGTSVHAFNPDNVNKELMMSTQHLQTMNQNPLGAQQGSNSNQHTGYNADQVNAGLYSSLNYNPNAVNSAMFNMPSFGTHGQNNGGAQSTDTHASTSAPGSQGSSGGATGPGHSGQTGTGQGVATGTGQGGAAGFGHGQGGATGTGQGGGTGTGQSGTSGNGLGVANGAGQSGAQGLGQSSTTGNGQGGNVGTSQLQQAGANLAGMPQATGIGGMGASSPFSQTGAGTGAPGGPIQPVNGVNQNGLPPGISSGMALSQTQANDPTVDGIGGLGK